MRWVSAAKDSSFLMLVRHFFGRFFDTESLSPQGEAETNVVQILSVLAVPGAFFSILIQPLTIRGWSLMGARYLFVSFSMIVMGFVMVFEWDSLFPDRRDYHILTPLPLRLPALFLAKVCALGLFLGLFLLDINFFAALFWPGIDRGEGTLAIFSAHITSVIAAGLFSALAAGAIQGVLITVLPAKAFRPVSTCIQTVLMGALVTLLFISPLIAGSLQILANEHRSLLQWFPGFWFLGFYESMRPAVRHPAIAGLGRTAVWALCAAAGLFLLTYLPGYRRHARKVLETPQPNPAGPGRLRRWAGCIIDRTLLKQPVQRAAFHFISQTITRSTKHRLFLATYSGFGVALAIMSLGSGRSGLLELPLTLSFILVSGLRAAFNFPSELRANWAFQISEGNAVGEYLAATRKWIVACGIVPLFLLVAPMEFALFPWTAALFHLAFGITLSVLLMQIMFLDFRKVPFTCTYFPGKVNLIGLGVLYIFGFTTYSYTMSSAESWLMDTPWAAAAFFAGTALICRLLGVWRSRLLTEEPCLTYDDPADPVVRTLDLTVIPGSGTKR
jgi:hypothetical protein